MSKILIAVLIITFVSIFVLSKMDPKHPNYDDNQSITIVDESFVTISITGEVSNPGSYIIQKDAILEELILSAGGLTSNADERTFNESIQIKEGVSYYIGPLYDKNDICQDNPLVKVNINAASQEELATLTGIGQATAGAIVAYRDSNGHFNYLEQIMEVKGIGNSTFEKIKNYITLR
ncbi:MAG: hypothetical protein GX350_04440 [Erysipelotrichaceae bacterium]|nr:hypothetical protein [Erysipelotrichaceae bacterium]